MSEQKPPEDEFESHRAQPAEGAPPEGPAVERPDWLVGSDEGAAGEVRRNADEVVEDGPQLARPVLPVDERGVPEKKPAKPVAWTAAASSVPTLRRQEGPPPNPPGPTFEPPIAEPEEAWPGGPNTTSGSATALPTPPQKGEPSASAFRADEFPMDDLPAGAEIDGDAPVGRATATIAPLKEPWWAIALDALRSNRVLQAVIAVSAVAFVVWKMWPSPVPSLHIAKIHADPETFDGLSVELHGKVGEVFPVGGGYAFYLHQGGDTIVVFTRSRVPVSREKVSVLGSVSTGYLDGVARPALFEQAQP